MSDTTNKAVAGPEARVRDLVEEVIAGTSTYLVEVIVRGRKGSQVVEVYLDDDGGVGVDELARVSREVGFLLDTEDVIAGKYNLNVSSPGVDRPLVAPRQFKKNVGRDLQVRYRVAEQEKPVTVQGTLESADDEGIDLRASRKDQRRIAYDDIHEAKVQLPW